MPPVRGSKGGMWAVLVLTGLLGAGCGPDTSHETGAQSGSLDAVLEAPPPPPETWADLIGEYASGSDTLSVLEDQQTLFLLFWKGGGQVLRPLEAGGFEMEGNGGRVSFAGRDTGVPAGVSVGERGFHRITMGAEEGDVFRIDPLRSPAELRREALSASPPNEEAPPVGEGEFLSSDLVDLTQLDSTILLDIRYASTDNFMGEAFYSSARAFLQRPAAEALIRAHEWLKARGYGLVVFDGYRPWYVTRMFWDATPERLRDFVADPASGSRHNRGCAVDLTLYDLETGEAVDMPSGYDEMSPRSHANYPGGTSRQRWHRKLLRQAMEAQGFQVYPGEWWHFDYQDWGRYHIQNQTFEEIVPG